MKIILISFCIFSFNFTSTKYRKIKPYAINKSTNLFLFFLLHFFCLVFFLLLFCLLYCLLFSSVLSSLDVSLLKILARVMCINSTVQCSVSSSTHHLISQIIGLSSPLPLFTFLYSFLFFLSGAKQLSQITVWCRVINKSK